MMKQRLSKAWHWSLTVPPLVLPYIAGPLVRPMEVASELFVDVSELFGLFLVLFGLWAVLRSQIPLLLKASGKESSTDGSRSRNWLRFLSLGVLFLFTVGSLELLQSRVTVFPFYLILTGLGLSVLADALQQRGYVYSALVFSLGFTSLIAYLSFLLISGQWLWQPIPLALGISCNAVSLRVLALLCSDEAACSERGKRLLLRIYPILLVLAPFFPALLVYFRELPNYYLLLMFAPLLATRQLSRMRQENVSEMRSTVLHSGAAIASIYVLIFVAIQFVGEDLVVPLSRRGQ